nr:unnamed protein product [Digitaria exilis]
MAARLSNVCLSPSNTVPVKSVNSRTARTVASAKFCGRTRVTRKLGDSCTPMRPVPSALVSGTTVSSTDCLSTAPGVGLETVDEDGDGRVRRGAGDGEDDVAREEARAGGGGAREDLGDQNPGELRLDGDADGERLRVDDEEGEGEVGDDAGGDDEEAVGDGAVTEEVGVVGREAGLRVVVGEADVAAERDGAERVLDGAEAEAGERRAEADGELGDVDAPGRRGEEVPRLVDQHDGGQDGGRGGNGLDAGEKVRRGGGDDGGLGEVAVVPRQGEREREVHGEVVVVEGGVEGRRDAGLGGGGEMGGNHGGTGGGGGRGGRSG